MTLVVRCEKAPPPRRAGAESGGTSRAPRPAGGQGEGGRFVNRPCGMYAEAATPAAACTATAPGRRRRGRGQLRLRGNRGEMGVSNPPVALGQHGDEGLHLSVLSGVLPELLLGELGLNDQAVVELGVHGVL